jgi:hypothetical protein
METVFKEYVVLNGYLLLFCRFILLITTTYFYFFKKYQIPSLFWYSLIVLFLNTFELALIWSVKTYPSMIRPVLQKIEIENTFFVSPLYYLTDIICWGLFYIRATKAEAIKKVYSNILICLFILECLNTLLGEGYKDAQTFGSLGNSIFQIILTFLYIKNFYSTKFGSTKDSFLIISWSVFISSTLSIFVYFLTNYLFKNDTILYYKISIFRMIIESLCLLLMAYGVTISREQRHKTYLP